MRRQQMANMRERKAMEMRKKPKEAANSGEELRPAEGSRSLYEVE